MGNQFSPYGLPDNGTGVPPTAIPRWPPGAGPGWHPATPPGGGMIQPPQFLGGAGLADPNYQPAPAAPSLGSIMPQNGIPGGQSQFDADQAYIQAQQNLLGGKEALLGLQPMLQQSKQRELAAREAQSASQGAYLAEQTRANAERLAEQQAIQAAGGNVQDIMSVARAQSHRNSQAYIYRLGGMAAPVEVALPPGFKGPMPPGVVARLQTLAEILTDASKDKEVMRKFNEDAARIATARLGIEVDAAQIASGKTNLLLDEAEAVVQRLGLYADRAQLAQRQSRLPPAPGMEFDDESQQWVAASELRALRRERSRVEREAEANEKPRYGGLSGLSQDTLMSMLTEGQAVLTERQFREALASPPHNRTPEQVEALVGLAYARRPNPSTGGLTDADISKIDALVNKR